MRIEINLLPGAKRGRRKAKGASLDFKAIGAGIAARFKDVWLSAAIGSGVVAALAIGVMFLLQRSTQANLDTALEKAVADSSRFAVVLDDRARAQAKRDSALMQLDIIRAIDGDRFIWPHILDEISRAIPPFTWIRSLTFTGTAQGTNPAAAYRPPPPDTSKRRRGPLKIELPRDTVRFHLVGRTVDIQAFTRFYRTLEDSPFLGGVQFTKTENIIELGREVTSFEFDVVFTRPDSSLLRRVSFTTSPPPR